MSRPKYKLLWLCTYPDCGCGEQTQPQKWDAYNCQRQATKALQRHFPPSPHMKAWIERIG